LSVVSENLVNPRDINRAGATPVQAANRETLFSLGKTQLGVKLGNRTVQQQALVLSTSAIPAVLGLDFLMKPPSQGILTSREPRRLIFDHQEYPLRKLTVFQDVSKLYKITHATEPHMPWKSEAYTLHPMVKAKSLEALGVDSRDIEIDLFVNHKNHTRELYCRKETSTFLFYWAKVDSLLCANPPWTQLLKVTV